MTSDPEPSAPVALGNGPPAPRPPTGLPMRCSDAADRRDDPLEGTAPPVRWWLLIEHPGPWGRRVLADCGIDPGVAAALGRWSARAGGRVVLIRRPGRRDTPRPRRWATVDCRPGHEATRWGTYGPETDLLAVLDDPDAGHPSEGPTYLVCAHGRHDTCCAVRGRPVAAAFAALRPDRTWECTHVGGDRFAANAVLLPHGVYLGRVPATEVPELVRRYEHGEIDPRYLRGRASYPAPVQAAQYHAMRALGETGLDALPPLRHEQLRPGVWRAELALDGSGQVAVVTVAERTVLADTPLTCSALHRSTMRVWDLVALERRTRTHDG